MCKFRHDDPFVGPPHPDIVGREARRTDCTRCHGLFSIAKRYEETVEQILIYNKMGEEAVLKAGQRIVVKRVE